MESFTIIDGVVAIIVIVSALLAYSRGFLREVMAITGWIAATVIAFLFADTAKPLVQQIPILDKFLSNSCELLTIASFVVVFAIALIVFALFTPLLSSLMQRTFLNSIDQILGFFFGIFRGIVLIIAALFLYQKIAVGQNITLIENSRSAAVFGGFVTTVEEQNPDQATNWIQDKYDQLISNCR